MEEQRLRVVEEARRWLGTPHMHRQHVIGAGIDCALFLMEAFAGAELIERFEPEFYTHDWHMHQGEERYLATVERYARPLDDSSESVRMRLRADPSFRPEMADILLMRVGQTYSHGAIVTDWPCIIHAYFPSGIVEEVSILGTPMMVVPTRLYSYWGREA
jgi:hypothetical protein